MDFSVLNCQDELFHLCGKIQKHGYLLVFDFQKNCVAISENCEEWLLKPVNTILNTKLDIFENFFNITINIEGISSISKILSYEADLYQVTLNDKNYQLSVYLDEHHIFLELEENKNEAIDFSKLHAFHAAIDTSEDVWQSLCYKFYDILKFDRIMIYQFLEDNTGKVIAESIHGELTSVLNF